MQIVELLKEAKKLYLKNIGKVGMCWCIKVIANQNKTRKEQSDKGHVPYASIRAQIPEFNPFYLEELSKNSYFVVNFSSNCLMKFPKDSVVLKLTGYKNYY